MLLLISVRHNHDFNGAFPRRERLARESGWSVRTIANVINALERKGVLAITYSRLPDGAMGNVYRFVGLDTIPPDAKRRRLGGRPKAKGSRAAALSGDTAAAPTAAGTAGARGTSVASGTSGEDPTPDERDASPLTLPTPDERPASRQKQVVAAADDSGAEEDESEGASTPGKRVTEESEEAAAASRVVRVDAQEDAVVAVPVLERRVGAGVTRRVAEQLAAQYERASIERQVAWLPYRDADKNPAGALVDSIRQAWPAPSRWLAEQRSAPARAQAAERLAAMAAAEAQRATEAAEQAARDALLTPLDRIAGSMRVWLLKERALRPRQISPFEIQARWEHLLTTHPAAAQLETTIRPQARVDAPGTRRAMGKVA